LKEKLFSSVVLREVLLVGGLLLFLVAGHSIRRSPQASIVPEAQTKPTPASPYGPPTVVARLKDTRVDESSGLVASRANPGVYWTHNDSGDDPVVYAFAANGDALGAWRVTGAENDDWEDIAVGPGPQSGKSYIYIGDTGDNNESRAQIVVYSVVEPTVDASAKENVTERAVAYRFKYPDGKHDAETLLVHPTTGKLYIVTKIPLAKPTIYEASPPFESSKVTTLKRLGELRVPSVFGGVLTGGDISPDGRRVVFCDYFQGFEMALPANASSFDDIWQERMVGFDLGKRNQGESIAYRLDGKAVLATSEGKRPELIQVVLK
jgi:hypothetical protein